MLGLFCCETNGSNKEARGFLVESSPLWARSRTRDDEPRSPPSSPPPCWGPCIPDYHEVLPVAVLSFRTPRESRPRAPPPPPPPDPALVRGTALGVPWGDPPVPLFLFILTTFRTKPLPSARDRRSQVNKKDVLCSIGGFAVFCSWPETGGKSDYVSHGRLLRVSQATVLTW